MKKIIYTLTGLALSTLFSCYSNPVPWQKEAVIEPRKFITNATLLEIDTIGAASACRIHNPWQPNKYLAKYLLLPADTTLLPAASAAALRKRYPGYIPLTVPLQRMTLTNSCHVFLMDQLQAMDNVAAVCDTRYVHVSALQRRLKAGTIINAGSALSPNTEKLLATRTDAIWIPPFENAGAGAFERFNVPIIYCAEYMEPHPLSRAEWMKFYGRLVGRGHEADSLFKLVKFHYRAISELEVKEKKKPTVMAELPVGDTWTIPGGRSATSRLYRDAGGIYLWNDDNHVGSLTLSFEAVYNKAHNADHWFFTFYDTTSVAPELSKLRNMFPFMSKFKAGVPYRFHGCNTAYCPYFEEMPFRPDLLLWSIRRELYRELLPAIIFGPGDTLVDPFYFYDNDIMNEFIVLPL